MKKIIPLFITIFGFIVAIYLLPYMPSTMASHWGIDGQVNGTMSKFWGLFFMPILSVVLYILFLFLPKLDPYKKNFSEFKNYYDNFMVVIFGFFFYIYTLTIFWNLNFRFNMVQFLSPAFSVLFYFTAVLIGKTKRNWFVGIRTPWTMSSPKVWQKTHILGGKLFKLVSLSSLLGTFFPSLAFFLLFIPLILTVFILFYYSWLVSR